MIFFTIRCYVNNSSTFTLTSGEISKNSAEYGGGVYVSGGTFIMKGGSISNNTVTENGKGKGVHVVKSNNIDSLFEISGDASITEDNDVYLAEDQKITITGELTFNGYVATITPANYAETVQVLAPGKDFALDEELVIKFKVTKYSDNVETIITIITIITAITEEKGCLKNTLNDAEDLKVDPNLYDICSTIYVSTADGMKAISDLSQKIGDVAGKDFAGKTINLKAHVELDDEYKPIHTFSGVFDGKDHTITLTKPSEFGYYTNFYLGGAIFNVITGENAKVIDLNVSGEAYIAGIAIDLENDAVISNCTNSANITSPDGNGVPACGGIVGGLSNGGFIENCINYGIITYNSTNYNGCGGIVGAISSSDSKKGNSIIANCINNKMIIRVQEEGKKVESNVSIGGICGKVEGNAAIYNCANKGDVTSEITDTSITENIGGITGYCSVSFYEGEFPSLPANSIPDDMGIFNCYNSGEISSRGASDSKYIGGIVGKGRVGFANSVYHTIRVTNTVNNDKTTFSIGNIIKSGSPVVFDITNNFYKFYGPSPLDPYESTFYNNLNTFVTKLNEYSTKSNGKYLQWCIKSTNIIFSGEIIGN